MRKFLSERNCVIVLFIAALVVFSFAQEDAKKRGSMSIQQQENAASLLPTPASTAQQTGTPDTLSITIQ
jgi:hypothetical protein